MDLRLDRLPKKLHLMTIWLAAIGTMLSAIFILAANSWMQNPVGSVFNPATDRAEMADLGAVLDQSGHPGDLPARAVRRLHDGPAAS